MEIAFFARPDQDRTTQILRTKGKYPDFFDPVVEVFDPLWSARIFYGLDDRPPAFQCLPARISRSLR